MPLKVVSGGQTGVDRAALDVARELGLPHGGWCPRGRRSENGVIPHVYELTETPESRYEQRTEWNVRDADATLLLFRDELSGGTAFTLQCVRSLGRSHAAVDLGCAPDPLALAEWIAGFRVLNVAGPRESRQPGIYEEARRYLLDLLGPGRRIS
jgi:putative molybdenum carrier protein